MKRFYQDVSVAAGPAGHEVRLDGRPIKTPAKQTVAVPSVGLAEALAAEWAAQGDTIKPETMPMTRLANSAIDGVAERPADIVAEIAGFAETDLICYWAEHPKELVARQAHGWRPLMEWAERKYGAKLHATSGVMHRPQPEASLAALRAAVAEMEPFRLAALHMLTTAMGSVVLALVVAERHLDAESAFDLSEIDERFQRESWGEDPEAAARRTQVRVAVQTAARFLILLGGEAP